MLPPSFRFSLPATLPGCAAAPVARPVRSLVLSCPSYGSSGGDAAESASQLSSLLCQSYLLSPPCPAAFPDSPERTRFLSTDGLVSLILDPTRSRWVATSSALGDAACTTNRALAIGAFEGSTSDGRGGGGAAAPVQWLSYDEATGAFDAPIEGVAMDCRARGVQPPL